MQCLNQQGDIGSKQPDRDSEQNDAEKFADDVDSPLSEKTFHTSGHTYDKVDPQHIQY